MNLDDLVWVFLFYQQSPTSTQPPPLPLCPTTETTKKISVFHSATTVFCVPSNPSGTGGLYHKTIRCTPRWQMGHVIAPQRDCIVLNTGSDAPGMRGLEVARVHLFFHLRSAMTSSHVRSSTIFAKPLMTQTLIMGCGSLSLTLTPMGIGSCLSYTWT